MNFQNSSKKIKNNLLKRENIFNLIIILTIFFLDRISKFKVLNDFYDRDYFINNFLNIDLIWNTGIGFGLLSTDSSLIYNLITFVIIVVMLILLYLILTAHTIDKIIYSMIMGGALGNFYDRLTYKAVPDFIDLHFNNFHWFTFNIADIFITFGIIGYLVSDYNKKNEKN